MARRVCLEALARLKKEQIQEQIAATEQIRIAASKDGDEVKHREAMNRLQCLRKQLKNVKV